jgi:hypothetical protein
MLFFYNSLNLSRFVRTPGRSVTRVNPSAQCQSPANTYIYIYIYILYINTPTWTPGRSLPSRLRFFYFFKIDPMWHAPPLKPRLHAGLNASNQKASKRHKKTYPLGIPDANLGYIRVCQRPNFLLVFGL